jgi:2-methylcitrate dehydratase
MLTPNDYSYQALYDETTRKLMQKVNFIHGGVQYDINYPKGIPTKVVIKTTDQEVGSPMVMFPGGHARNETVDLQSVLDHKFKTLGALVMSKNTLNKYFFTIKGN